MSLNESTVEDAALSWFGDLGYAARIVRHPLMQNPTLVVLTDRNDLDDQLFGQFQRCADILGQMPVQAGSRNDLHSLLNRAISTMQVIEELIKLAKDLDAASKRGQDLGLSDDEVAFYDALAANESAVIAMGDDKLRESARARIRVMVKRILNKYGYPPDLQDEAVKTVLAQVELLSAEWGQA